MKAKVTTKKTKKVVNLAQACNISRDSNRKEPLSPSFSYGDTRAKNVGLLR